jgi:hypothetical protein
MKRAKKNGKPVNGLNGSVLLFGCMRPDTGIGRMVNHLVKHEGKAVKAKVLRKLAAPAELAPRLYRLRVNARRTGFFSFGRSKRVSKAYVLHVKNWKAYLHA